MTIIPSLLLLLPLVSALAIFLVVRRDQFVSSLLSVGSSTICLLLSLLFLGSEDAFVNLVRWIDLGEALKVNIGLRVDQASRGMMLVVSVIGAAVHWYSLCYMKDDPARARYFGSLSLFMFSMTGIVLADNLIMMFIFWELVGVSSYLLIGHWFEKDSAADASKKAFLTNRIGDFGFMLGILILWGTTGMISFDGVEKSIDIGMLEGGMLTAAALLIFCGTLGKSAQMPLHVWLPDAMEGPTPVSALIHAATMVAAGVFMLFRVDFLFEAAPSAGMIVAWIGGITALLAALFATQQDDIKRILAYSTLSQLGYMVMVVGLGHADAAMYHLFTHAFFKALLFLGAGAVIHACHHQQDIWKMGGLAHRMPITFVTFAIGTAALIAVPLFSGFFSKEFILSAAWKESKPLFLISVVVAFLTAFYMLRLVVVTFFGSPRTEDAEKAHEVPTIMWVPLVVLAIPSVLAWPFDWLIGWTNAVHPEFHWSWLMAIISIVAVAAGAGLGFVKYLDKRSEPRRITPLANKLYFDEVYEKIVKYGQDRLAWIVKGIDEIIIGGIAVGGITKLVSGLGGLVRRVQLGNLQGYAFLFGGGVIAVIYLIVFFL